MSSHAVANFTAFFHDWLTTQENYANQLVSLISQTNSDGDRDRELGTLVQRVLAHYQDYYIAKSRLIASSDVTSLVFSPPWLSTLEQTFLWVAGFRPSMVLKVLDNSAGSELNEEQAARVEHMKADVMEVERVLNDEVVMLQNGMAERSWHELVGGGESVFDTMMDQLRGLVGQADSLRSLIAWDLVQILSPVQAGKFFAAIARLHLRVRACAWDLVQILSPVQAGKFFAAIARLHLRVRACGLQKDAEQ